MTGGSVPEALHRCATCGVAVPDPRDLLRVRDSGRRVHVCPTCATRLAQSGWGRQRLVSFLWLVAPLSLLAAVSPVLTWVDVARLVLLLGLATALHVVVHEAAHSLVALALGMGVPSVQLGDGPVVLRLRLRGTTIDLRGFHSGATHLEPTSTGLLRLRLGVAVAAGPLSNLVLAAVAFWFTGVVSGSVQQFAGSVVAVGLFVGILNLLPLRYRSGAAPAQTDGRLLIDLLAGAASGDQIVAASRLQAAQRRHLSGEAVADEAEDEIDSEDPVILGMEGTRRILLGRYDEAVALLRRAVATPQDDGDRALSLNNLAWALLRSRPDGWLPEADQASAEALALRPWIQALMGTRGCVLLHLGMPTDARDLLRRAIEGDAAPPELVVLHSHLVHAEHSLGNLFAARSSLLAMLELGAEPEQLAAARAVIRRAEVDNALGNLVGADGRIAWPDDRARSREARHLREIREALTTFAAEPDTAGLREAVRAALGPPAPASD